MAANDQLLSAAQNAALLHVRNGADSSFADAIARLQGVHDRDATGFNALSNDGRIDADAVRLLCDQLLAGSRVTVHFHPDRICNDGRSVAVALAEDGLYKSQFETGISNGGLGGPRDSWERRLFGGAYHPETADPSFASERPIYGGLDLGFRSSDGACPRFGSCFFVLKPSATMHRCSFSVGDSFLEPKDLGTADSFATVLAGLLELIAQGQWNLGQPDFTVTDVLALTTAPQQEPSDYRSHRKARSLDQYVEVQMHGRLRLREDIDLLVCDPSFKDTHVGQALVALADRHGIALQWNQGFRLPFDQVPADFRGPVMPVLAERLRQLYAPAHQLHVELIGRAAVSVVGQPENWADLGTQAEVLQYLKQLWHVLVQFGE